MTYLPVLYDSQEKVIESPLCHCGKKADTFIANKVNIIWFCDDCFNGTFVPVDLIYVPDEVKYMPEDFENDFIKKKYYLVTESHHILTNPDMRIIL
jgi:hypothetical protein